MDEEFRRRHILELEESVCVGDGVCRGEGVDADGGADDGNVGAVGFLVVRVVDMAEDVRSGDSRQRKSTEIVGRGAAGRAVVVSIDRQPIGSEDAIADDNCPHFRRRWQRGVVEERHEHVSTRDYDAALHPLAVGEQVERRIGRRRRGQESAHRLRCRGRRSAKDRGGVDGRIEMDDSLARDVDHLLAVGRRDRRDMSWLGDREVEGLRRVEQVTSGVADRGIDGEPIAGVGERRAELDPRRG